MLRFKDNQLTNLKAIHAEIVESARKEIVREKLLRQQNQQKLATRMKTLEDLRTKLGQKENLIRYIEDLSKEKIKLDKSLEILREEEATKMTMRSGAIRTVVESIVHNYKGKVEAECEEKIKIVRDSSMVAKSSKELKKMLDNKGIPERSYYTFSQLKYVLEFNHKTNKTGEKILDIFEREIKPKLMEVVEDIEEPQELTDLRSEIIRLEDFKGQDEAELKQQQFAIQQLEL